MFLSLKLNGPLIQTNQNITLCSFLNSSEEIIKTRNSSKEFLANVLTKS